MMTVGDVLASKHPEKPRRYWMGSKPCQCDICHGDLDTVFVDGATVRGPWAMMCPKCHGMFGVGLGMGRGQEYTRDKDRWWKTGG